MGVLKGYVQKSLYLRANLHALLTQRASSGKIPVYAVVEAAFSACIQNSQIKKRVLKAVTGRSSVNKESGYSYVPVYVKEDDYKIIKITSVAEGAPMYILIEEIIVQHLLDKKAYTKYVEKHFSQKA